ncbi:hypothetical protein M378DRAFT_10708 [Amanita muscaria Koide BX008]|uniref:Uncharacterized protein n=1 Tax=Amanita muscaria (strain Koide BX008) TaxID=946122 RepID=A0A0C2X9Z1_AMAMK|nr:hypothetical protein M378DRAFT_10708 [Amanita muscaria Koide BX008]
MSKPIVTYMRKKNRTLGQEDINNLLNVSKRSRAQSSAYNNLKKPKTSMIEDLQTPYPTALSESQVFRLLSSRGHPLPPDHEFSPVPPAPKNAFNPNSSTASTRRAYMKRSTRFLKENDTNGIASESRPASRSRSQVRNFGVGTTRLGLRHDMSVTGRARNDLASPFSSRPSSPTAFSGEGAADNLLPGAARDIVPKERVARIDATSPTRSLRSSPTYGDESMVILSARRPSAPTTSRPKLHDWTRLLPQVSDSTSRESTKRKCGRESTSLYPSALEPSSVCPEPTFSLSATFSELEKWTWSDEAIDFNRPPSQLSFHTDFFEDAQGASTPLRDIKSRQRSNYLADDPEMDSINQQTLRSLFLDDEDSSTVNSVANSWISDSLISPPSIYQSRKRKNRLEWCARNEGVYSDEDEDEDHAPDRGNSDVDAATHALSSKNSASHNLSIKDVIPNPSFTNDATSKTTSSSDISERTSGVKPHPPGRKRRGTIRAAEITSQPQKTTQARRNRSGTIVGPAAARRSRSGTIIGPASQIRGSHASIKVKSTTSAVSDGGDQGTFNVDSINDTIVVDEDELNSFNKEWVDEPWTVADPPSPVASRTRKNMRSARTGKVQPIHKRIIIKQPRFGLQEDIAENAEGESDDELLLK